jgi:hypothetical protein
MWRRQVSPDLDLEKERHGGVLLAGNRGGNCSNAYFAPRDVVHDDLGVGEHALGRRLP